MSAAKFTLDRKKETMIAVLLVVCLLLGVAVMLLVENNVGIPVYYDGDMKNICVRINEICLSNNSTVADENGLFSDYIELYNYGDTFPLAGFGLSDNTKNGIAYTFGDIEFRSGQYLVVFLDGKTVPFKLSSDGNEYISLVAWDGTVICSATTMKCGTDSVMLYSDTGYYVSDEPSPGYPNDEDGILAFKNGVLDDAPSLVINELLISNGSVLPDYEGEYCDIIEIRNATDTKLGTAGCYISDSLGNRCKCALPSVELEPGGYLLVYASGKATTFPNGEFHTDFRISDGEDVVLSVNGKYTAVKAQSNGANISQIRKISDDGSVVYEFSLPSPGFDNGEGGIEEFALSRMDNSAPLVISELMLSRDETAYMGKLRDVIEITNISGGDVSTKGWYISDSADDPYEYALPEQTVKAGECIVLYAEKGSGSNLTGFALSSGETVYLTTPEYKKSSSVSCAGAGRGKTWHRTADSDEISYVSGEPSVGFAENESGVGKYQAAVRPDTVEISEAVSLNTKYLAGPYGTYHDFVELHNRSDQSVTLDGWFLSDDPEEPRKASLDGITVPANGYRILILSTEGTNIPSGYKALAFSLASSGETLMLSQGDEIIDCMVMPSLGDNTSFGRADGADGFSVLSAPTPGAQNGSAVSSATATPTAVTPQGVYESGSVSVVLSGEGTIYYTLDCTEPNAASSVYLSPITVTKTTVIRARAVKSGYGMSDTLSLTYIVNEGHTIDVVSLVTDPENLWNYYSGIYADGPNGGGEFPYVGANYWQPWEREANVSLFSDDGGFAINCGIKIFGAYSRALPMKSFACHFRAKYGASALNYRLYENDELNSYEALVLRNTGQDWNKAHMRDAMISSLVNEKTGVDVQNYRAVVLYLNGKYWGVYFIREKINENYIAGHYNVSQSEVDLCRASGTTSETYTALIKYVSTHDLSVQENYDYVASQVDIENYADYIIAEICMANTDNGNIRFYKTSSGKWRWIMFDVDQSFRSATDQTVAAHLNPNGTGSMDRFPTRLINGLLKNSGFRRMFLSRFAWQLENVWSPDVVNAQIDKFVSLIGTEMKRDCERWEREYSVWESSVTVLRTFIAGREQSLVSQVKSYFSLSDSEMRELGFDIG